MTPSRERTIGRAIVADPLVAKALAAFAASDDRTVPDAACTIVRRALVGAGWLVRAPGRGHLAGPRLEAHRRAAAPDSEDLAPVVPMVRPARTEARQ
jgi:hypothetical protein